jgi:hypothetical protein
MFRDEQPYGTQNNYAGRKTENVLQQGNDLFNQK